MHLIKILNTDYMQEVDFVSVHTVLAQYIICRHTLISDIGNDLLIVV